MKNYLMAAALLAAASAHAHVTLEQKIVQSCQLGSAHWEATLETR